jgi:hypothetical protein
MVAGSCGLMHYKHACTSDTTDCAVKPFGHAADTACQGSSVPPFDMSEQQGEPLSTVVYLPPTHIVFDTADTFRHLVLQHVVYVVATLKLLVLLRRCFFCSEDACFAQGNERRAGAASGGGRRQAAQPADGQGEGGHIQGNDVIRGGLGSEDRARTGGPRRRRRSAASTPHTSCWWRTRCRMASACA